jgi:amino acid adenylation domain-containing protein/FkbH-like protein
MLILSSFNADYLKEPLQFLIDQFSDGGEEIEINYGNVITSLFDLKQAQANKIVTVLFRLIDLVNYDGKTMDIVKLQKNLQLVIDAMDSVKTKLSVQFIVVLCPSLNIYDPILQYIEEDFHDEMQNKSLTLIKVREIQAYYSLTNADTENKVGKETHIPYTPKFYSALACFLARKLHNLRSKPYKVIVVDCDDTLWSGVVGDIGVENISFSEHHRLLQKFLVDKISEGMLICLCSKNDEKNVLAVFDKRHNDMLLTLDHIAKFKINWQFKSENIFKLAEELNLGLDSFIFIDDSVFEVEEVGHHLPDVLCIKAPQTVEEFSVMKDNWAFDTNIITDEDKNRTQLYKEDYKRQEYQSSFSNYIHFLESINLSILIEEVKNYQKTTIERISNLSSRTNQFNLFPLAKDTNEITNSLKANNVVFSVSAQDDFGSYGLIAVAFCHTQANVLSVDGFFVSCRAFKKGIEYHLIKHIAQYAANKLLDKINLCFKRTEKNRAAQQFISLLLQNFGDACADVTQLALDKEADIHFLSAQLAALEVNTLLEMQSNALTKPVACNVRKNTPVNLVNKKAYLLKLQRITQSLTFILDKFFFNEAKFLTLPTLESKVVMICNFLLGDVKKDVALICFGLDSLKATELSYYLYQIANIKFSITELLSKNTTVAIILVACLQQQAYINTQRKLTTPTLLFSEAGQIIDVSFQQKRLWFAEKKEVNYNNPSSHYIMAVCFSVAQLSISRFKTACWQLINRHDILGCSFFIQDKKLVQRILPIKDRPLDFVIHSIEDELSVKSFLLKEAKKNFLMDEMPLIRFSVFVVNGGSKFYILMRAHHGIFDALSLLSLFSEIAYFYNKKKSNMYLKHLHKYSYYDFICHQNSLYNTEGYQTEATRYWSKALSGLSLTTEFPYDKASTIYLNPTLEHPCKRYSFFISHKKFLALQQLAQSTATTLFNLAISIFSILVSAYTYEDKVGIITATTGRNIPKFHRTIGFFVNLMVLPFSLEKNISFFEYATANYQLFLESILFQELPFEKIQEITKQQGINNILANPALIYQSYKTAELILDDEKACLEIPENPILYDLREVCRFGAFTLFLQEGNRGMEGLIEYSQSAYSDAFIERIANNFVYLVDNLCNNPYQTLHNINCVSEKEQAELLNFNKGPLQRYNEKENLISIFQQQVFNYPESSAIAYNGLTFTYRELDKLSSNLANSLAKKGIGIHEKVGLYFASPFLFFIAELAVLKLAAVFIPLSKADPKERLTFIIQHAELIYVISDSHFSIPLESSVQLIQINKQTLEQDTVLREEAYLLNPISLDSSACILYTSGSTGTPKGVRLKQGGIVRVVKSAGYEIDNHDRILQAANLAFDAAQLECWLAWTNGACLVIVDKEILLDYKLFEEKLFTEKITILWLTAALFHQYAYIKPAIFRSVNYLIVGGDIIDKQALQEVFYCEENKSLKLRVGYGPTEAGIFTTICTITSDIFNDFSSIPIGSPINNTEIFLLDRFNNLAPMGAKAQLAISSDSLTEGYLNNAKLQNERFITCPELLSSTLYLSGDQVQLARIASPQLLFCGRLDNEQLKRGGFLVSLSEIKAGLISHPDIKQIELITKELCSKKKQLIAFYIRNENRTDLDNINFSDYLSDKLPPFMLPDVYQELKAFPITPNGKLDKRALLQLEINFSESSSQEVLTATQQQIAELFKSVLLLGSEDKLSLDDNFFNSGGTSTLAIQSIYKIEQQFGIRLSFNVFSQNASIRSIDKLLQLPAASIKLEQIGQTFSFVKLKTGDKKLPSVVFIHPAGGALYCYESLIKKTPLTNSFFGIEDPVLSHGLQQNLSFKEMATSYRLQIENNIEGPFSLSGYSLGGMLALEIAAQLEEKQENNLVSVFLIDTWIVACASEPVKYQLKAEVLDYYSKVRCKLSNTEKSLVDQLEQLEQRYRYLQDIGFAFKPRKLKNTRVTLLKATNLGSSFEHMGVETKTNYLLDFVNEKLFSCTYIPGNHYSILEEDIDSTASAFSEQVINLNLQTTKPNIVKLKNIPAPFFSNETDSDNMLTKFVANIRPRL